ncbi:major facilitator superfamily transporter [Ilyonectria destructans]|nr:major facilitator superfamily transporter [Ilyonectria destructans]
MTDSESPKASSAVDMREHVDEAFQTLQAPQAHFDADAESRLRKKIDLMILPIVSILYLFCFIDRSNIGNARLAGFEADLGMEGIDYNATLSIFYISYILFEIPSNILCKIVGPGWFLPILTILFGGCSVANGFVKNVPQAMAVRFLLGIFEAGMLPGIAYYLSRWYRASELVFRIACYVVTAALAGAFGALLASAILTMDSFGSLHTWRMIFAIEGMITMGLGIIALFILTDSPATARWLTPEEKKFAEARLRSERVGQSEVLDRIDKKKILRGIINPVTIATSVAFLFNNITVQGLSVFAPTIVRTIYSDRTVVQQQLYTAPPYLVGAFFTLLVPYFSWKLDKRQIFLALCPILTAIGYIMFLASTDLTVRYAAFFLVAAMIFVYAPLSNGQVSANVVSDTARSSAIGWNVMIGNIGGLISTWAFLPFDGPNYPIGNGINLAAQVVIMVTMYLTLLWMKRDNLSRDEKQAEAEIALSNVTAEDIADLDWKHPLFRWRI